MAAEQPAPDGNIVEIEGQNLFARYGPKRWFKRFTSKQGIENPIKNYLLDEIDKNDAKVNFLKTIEGKWKKLEDEYLWGSEGVVNTCKQLGFYGDAPELVEREKNLFGTGSGTPMKVDKYGNKTIEPVPINHGGVFREDLFVLGSNAGQLIRELTTKVNSIKGEKTNIKNHQDNFLELIAKISKYENEYRQGLVDIDKYPDKLKTLRQNILDDTKEFRQYVRFHHTYKVIKSSVRVNGENISFQEKNPNFKPWSWEEENGIGFDENGYPLEIDDQGIVLLDKWMVEIYENNWQKKIIGRKKGGLDFLRKCEEIISKGGPRRVNPLFAREDAFLDTLEIAAYIMRELNTFRDDLRDGRYHHHSKTATDYIIWAEGRPDGTPNFGPTIRKDNLLPDATPAFHSFNPLNANDELGYIKASPEMFEDGASATEKKVVRTYSIREFGANGIVGISNQKVRQPHDLNPAFDRRALKMGKIPIIHWGRMLYYEGPEGITRWSENPYPCVSTRGVAKYLMYHIAVHTEKYDQAIDTGASQQGYDIGPHTLGSSFPRNLFR